MRTADYTYRNGRRLSQRKKAICRFDYQTWTGFQDGQLRREWRERETEELRTREKERERRGKWRVENGTFRIGWNLTVVSYDRFEIQFFRSTRITGKPCCTVGSMTREYQLLRLVGIVYNSARRTYMTFFTCCDNIEEGMSKPRDSCHLHPDFLVRLSSYLSCHEKWNLDRNHLCSDRDVTGKSIDRLIGSIMTCTFHRSSSSVWRIFLG